MKNKEKYAREIIEVACSGYCFGMDKSTNKILPCICITCRDCVFGCNVDCRGTKRKWAESEYIEKPVIRKKEVDIPSMVWYDKTIETSKQNSKGEQNMSENKGNKLVVDDIEVIVGGTANKPYYGIKYREVGNDNYNIGFGSYDLNNVLKWKEEEFEVVSEKENKETKQEVTNEQILKDLKEIEIAQGCIANGINTLFSVMNERKEQLKLNRVEEEIIKHGQIALGCLTERMADISGMNEELNRREKEIQAFEEEDELNEDEKEDMKGFVDFLKEIFE